MKRTSSVGTKVARAHQHERKKVRDMVIDRPVVHKIPMVRMSADVLADELAM